LLVLGVVVAAASFFWPLGCWKKALEGQEREREKKKK